MNFSESELKKKGVEHGAREWKADAENQPKYQLLILLLWLLLWWLLQLLLLKDVYYKIYIL